MLLYSVAWGKAQNSVPGDAPSSSQQTMPGMDMSGPSGHDMSNMQMKDMSMGADKNDDASAHVMNSMEGHMDMGPHMKMTALRPSKPDDLRRAQASRGGSAQGLGEVHRLSRCPRRRLQDFPA